MFDTVQVFQTGTVVEFVEYNDLRLTNISHVSQLNLDGVWVVPLPIVQHTLYAGYLFASKHVTCDAMKPAPPVMRIALVMSALNQLHSLRGLQRPWYRSTVTTSVVLSV